MQSLIDHLKSRARILHRGVGARNLADIDRVRVVDELADLDDDAVIAAARRRHCLNAVAREIGFESWGHASSILSGRSAFDFGTLLSPANANVHWNIWSASYDEARTIRDECDGYLLAYKRHFFIADRHYVAMLGLDPDDPDWARIDRDWVRPGDMDARTRLYAKLIEARLAA